jgi:hypothetical protein
MRKPSKLEKRTGLIMRELTLLGRHIIPGAGTVILIVNYEPGVKNRGYACFTRKCRSLDYDLKKECRKLLSLCDRTKAYIQKAYDKEVADVREHKRKQKLEKKAI